MNVNGKHYRTIWLSEQNDKIVQIIDQRWLPHRFEVEDITTVAQMATAIKDMHLRGAGLIGAAAGYGMYLASMECEGEPELKKAAEKLLNTRPTAVNLSWAVERQFKAMATANNRSEQIAIAKKTAIEIADEDADFCRRIGEHGVSIIRELANKKENKEPVNILTHCNAGWLAFVDYGTATAPIYKAHDLGIPVHVWVDETRPRNQGARLTAWELKEHGVPHTVIVDNVGGHLMQHGQVDMVITGSDRTTYTGDVGNKIGTYLKALAANDNNVPFYTALPSSTFDWTKRDGIKETPIEKRGGDEVQYIQGLDGDGGISKVLLTPKDSPAVNYAFDITPARLVSGLITERGICDASEEGVLGLYPEKSTLTKKSNTNF